VDFGGSDRDDENAIEVVESAKERNQRRYGNGSVVIIPWRNGNITSTVEKSCEGGWQC
jgi:hypothetical protein